LNRRRTGVDGSRQGRPDRFRAGQAEISGGKAAFRGYLCANVARGNGWRGTGQDFRRRAGGHLRAQGTGAFQADIRRGKANISSNRPTSVCRCAAEQTADNVAKAEGRTSFAAGNRRNGHVSPM
jgi:hypothetical protein